MNKFTSNDISDLSGKTILITGGNSGIGFQTALVLAGKGADVIIGCRSIKNAEKAIADIKYIYPNAKVSSVIFDLASLKSIQKFTDDWDISKLDILINNAGVMNISNRTETLDGFEMQFGVNHLGHFALTLGLLPYIQKSQNPRVVTVASTGAYAGKIDFNNLNSEKKYRRMGAYTASKLANVMFANELANRYPNILSVAVHPGAATTNLQRHSDDDVLMNSIGNFLMKLMGQSQADAALPSLYAATSPDIVTNKFYGPVEKFNKGGAGIVKTPKRAKNEDVAKKLWDVSEKLIQNII